jgi:hypothetical protein
MAVAMPSMRERILHFIPRRIYESWIFACHCRSRYERRWSFFNRRRDCRPRGRFIEIPFLLVMFTSIKCCLPKEESIMRLHRYISALFVAGTLAASPMIGLSQDEFEERTPEMMTEQPASRFGTG